MKPVQESQYSHEESTAFNKKAMAWVLTGGILLMALKFLAWYLTQSAAIFTDALESIINVVAAAFALYSIHLSSLPRDENHPYGHGKVEFFAAGFEGAMIIAAAVAISVEAIRSLVSHHEVKQIDLGIVLTFVAGLINMLMGLFLIRTGKRHHSLTLVADGKHLLSDTLSSAGLVGGLLLLMIFKVWWLDGALALVLAASILYTGIGLVRKSIAGLMDETDFLQIQEVIDALNRNRKTEWIDVHNMRLLKYGRMLHIDCHVTIPWYFSLEKAHSEVAEIEKILNREFGDRIELFIHADPCIPASCTVCMMENCPERKQPFRTKMEWKRENILPNRKHGTATN